MYITVLPGLCCTGDVRWKTKARKLFNYDNPPACARCEFKARCTKARYPQR